jgi:hypothetical protein
MLYENAEYLQRKREVNTDLLAAGKPTGAYLYSNDTPAASSTTTKTAVARALVLSLDNTIKSYSAPAECFVREMEIVSS